MPEELESIHSPTIAPMKHAVALILNDEKRYGMDDGRRRRQRIVQRDALTTRARSYRSGSTARNPEVMFTRVGKNDIRTVTARIGLDPTLTMGSGSNGSQPITEKITTMIGTMTMTGIVCTTMA